MKYVPFMICVIVFLFTSAGYFITDKKTGQTFQGKAFPEFMQKIIKAEGLVNYINNK